jgi:hypothetical protein
MADPTGGAGGEHATCRHARNPHVLLPAEIKIKFFELFAEFFGGLWYSVWLPAKRQRVNGRIGQEGRRGLPKGRVRSKSREHKGLRGLNSKAVKGQWQRKPRKGQSVPFQAQRPLPQIREHFSKQSKQFEFV